MTKKQQIIFELIEMENKSELAKYFICWEEAQKELLNEILNEVNLAKGNWSDIIEKKLVSLDTNKEK